MKKLSAWLPEIVFCAVLTALMMYPYAVLDFLPVEHDTFFHVSRIEHLSNAVRHLDLLPGIYPRENMNFGYASSLFYSDVLLLIPALLHILGLSVVNAYKLTAAASVFFACLSMLACARRITKDRTASFLAAAAYTFSNYRITDIYVRGAMGEMLSFIFLPVLIAALYRILWEKEDAWFPLACGLAGLVFCHNLTFLMGALLCALLFFIRIRHVEKPVFLTMCRGVFTAFLVTLFFTFPMIEQLKSQELIVSHYNDRAALGYYAMDPWQYIANRTVFGLAGRDLGHTKTMLENAGWFLTFVSFLYFFLPKEKKSSCITVLAVTGSLCLVLCGSWIPWDSLSFLGVLQFPWRLNTVAVPLLSVSASYAVCAFLKKDIRICAVIALLALESVYHTLPVLSRTFGIPGDMSWDEVRSGAVCDPCYSAYYARIELAGGDYLPVSSPDFRERERKITDAAGNDLHIAFTEDYDTLRFTLTDETGMIVLPRTWYKGYAVCKNGKRIDTHPSSVSLVMFESTGAGTYTLEYEGTWLRRICIWISLLTLLAVIAVKTKRPVRNRP
ncbi:MAG: hypothetical protein K6G61_01240 [Solobacterium sp.]|nr:hypothetical protein [Solobacterium sp.]